jgi:hypothetical protein
MTDSLPRSLLALDEEELGAVMAIAEPILISQRSAFLRALAAELQACPDTVGPGAIHRIGRELQRRFPCHQSATEARGRTRLHERTARKIG